MKQKAATSSYKVFVMSEINLETRAGFGAGGLATAADSGPNLSFVIPCYGSPESLQPLYAAICDLCTQLGLSFEAIFVDDRCPRNSWHVIRRLAEKDSRCIAIRLSRNFGQHAAIAAGISFISGRKIIVMDCDLQDSPSAVPAMLEEMERGKFDVVRARRVARKDPLYRRLTSRFFYHLLSFLTDTYQNPEIANFGVYDRKVIDAIDSWQEHVKYFPAIVEWVGFSQSTVLVPHNERYDGKSSYSFSRLVTLGLDIIVGFSEKPLRIAMFCGLAIAVLSFAVSLFILVESLLGSFVVQGWASVMLSVWFLAGCIILVLGLSGLYVGRILAEVKGRPNFIIDEAIRVRESGT